MPINSFIGSIMNMKADVLVQQNIQQPSGAMERQWVYFTTVDCKIEPIKSAGAVNRADNKAFEIGHNKEYIENFQVKMKSPIQLSRRSRVTNVLSNDGQQVFTEIDRINAPSMIFEVTASHAELDPFGRVNYYETTLRRVEVQYNDTSQTGTG